MKRKVLVTLSCFLVLAVAAFVLYSGTIFQRGNPLPYVSKMFALNDRNQYSKVFEDQGIYITRNGNCDALIKQIESTYGVTYTEQLGSAYLFKSENKSIIASTEIYWGRYTVWELAIQPTASPISSGSTVMDNPSLLSSWKPLTDLPSDYSKEQAITDGVYVNTIGAGIYNQALVDTFYTDALSGIAAFMRTMEYTEEGDPIITVFQYDGTIFTVTTDISHDKWKGRETEDISTVTYRYLVPLNRAVPASVPSTSSDAPAIYYLSNDENIFIATTDGRGVTLIDGLGCIPSPSNDVNVEYFQIVRDILFDGYEAVTVTDWTQLYGKALAKPGYLPERFRYYDGLFVKDNPGIPGNIMTTQLW